MTVGRFIWLLLKFVWLVLLTFIFGWALLLVLWHELIRYVGN